MPAIPATPLLPLFGRLLWMLLGPLALVIAVLAIVQRGEGWFTPPDLAFFAILAAMMFGRWLEFRGGHLLLAGDEPPAVELTRYLVRLSLGGLAVWAAANVVGKYWLVS